MENTVIKNISYEKTGKKIIEYFKSLGVDTSNNSGNVSEENKDICIYYGVINGRFDNYSLREVQNKNAKIIELPEVFEPKLGDRVLVWDDDESNAFEAIFLTEIKCAIHPIVTVSKGSEDDFLSGNEFYIYFYKNMKPIQEVKPQFVHLSFEDISNGEGVGVPPELIRIKK